MLLEFRWYKNQWLWSLDTDLLWWFTFITCKSITFKSNSLEVANQMKFTLFFAVVITTWICADHLCAQNSINFPPGSINPLRITNPGPSIRTNDVFYPPGSAFNSRRGSYPIGSNLTGTSFRIYRNPDNVNLGRSLFVRPTTPTVSEAVAAIESQLQRHKTCAGWVKFFRLEEFKAIKKDNTSNVDTKKLYQDVIRRIEWLGKQDQYREVAQLSVVREFLRSLKAETAAR